MDICDVFNAVATMVNISGIYSISPSRFLYCNLGGMVLGTYNANICIGVTCAGWLCHNCFRQWLVTWSASSHNLNKCWSIVNRSILDKRRWKVGFWFTDWKYAFENRPIFIMSLNVIPLKSLCWNSQPCWQINRLNPPRNIIKTSTKHSNTLQPCPINVPIRLIAYLIIHPFDLSVCLFVTVVYLFHFDILAQNASSSQSHCSHIVWELVWLSAESPVEVFMSKSARRF